MVNMVNMVNEKWKVFVLDTNVLMFNPNCIETLGKNVIIVPILALEEVDRIKRRHEYEQKGLDAREVSRRLEEYRKKGSLSKGVPTEAGGILIVDYNDNDFSSLPIGLEHNVDNRIMLLAKAWQKSMPKRPQEEGRSELPELPEFSEVWLITKDTNLRIKADACGISTEDYLHDKIIQDINQLYTGVKTVAIPEGTVSLFNGDSAIWQSHQIPADLLIPEIDLDQLLHNQCCQLQVYDRTISTIYKKDKGFFNIIKKQSIKGEGIKPINDEQWLAYALAMDPDISLLTIGGKAGSGKTLMALLAGWHQFKAGLYKKIIVYRPMDSLGKEMGALPGDVDEKFQPWTLPITDNMELILNEDTSWLESKKGIGHSIPIKELLISGVLEIYPITHLTGRSIHNVYAIVDETQNLTPHHAGIVASRAGKGSKFVFTGDPKQITNHEGRVDQISNGFVYTVESMKDLPLIGHMTLIKSERSALAELVATRMLL